MHFMKVRTGSVLIIMHSFVEKILFIRSTHLMCLKVLSYNLRKKVRSYRVKKTISEEGEAYRDGINITYINAEVDDQSEVAQLMKYFKIADPNDSSQGDLSKRVHFLKCEEEGKKIMCKVTDELIEIGKEIGKEIGESIGEERGLKRIVLRMAERGKSLIEILDDTGVSVELAQRWLSEAVAVGN